MRCASQIITGAFCCVLFLFTHLPAHADNWRWSGVDRVVAVADIHGAYDAFVDLLQHAAVINEDSDWNAGGTHLVIIGDVLDRGPGSRKALDLIMKLESQAAVTGGRVHMVLGNHEVMNLVGDLAYVSTEEFASYADDETHAARQAALARFRSAAGDAVADGEIIPEFDKKFPRGYFGHRELYSASGVYGQWLAHKPVLLQINDTVFVHGGLSRQALGSAGADINDGYALLLQQYLENWSVLSGAGILPPEAGFHDHARLLGDFLKQGPADGNAASAALTSAAERMLELEESPLLQVESVIWYRGNVMCNAVMAEDELVTALQQLNAARLVIGHTPTHNRRVLNRFDGKLVRADTGMLKAHYGGQPAAVIIDHGKIAVVYPELDTMVEPAVQPRLTGARPGSLTDDELEKLLMTAPVRKQDRQRDGSSLLQLEHDGQLIDALFTPALNRREDRIFIPEVAAYRLDRLLEFDLIPVTVMRVIDGEPGAVTLVQDSLMTEQVRRENRQGSEAWCPLGDQFNLMYLFDILAYNEGRSAEEIRYTNDWRLVLTGNRNLFAARSGKPRYLENAPINPPGLLLARLRALDADQLTAKLGDVIDQKRRLALLKRRDMLLEAADRQ